MLSLLGAFSLLSLSLLVALFNILQWLMAPYLVDAIYRVRALDEERHPELHRILDELSERSGISRPRLMLAELPIPNAFAYGSPLTGGRVAVTSGLLRTLELEEVEAVIGHELGHIRHRDVQVMMFASFLPSLFYLLARSTLYPYYGYYTGRRRGDYTALALVGAVSMFIYFLLLIFTLSLSRLREYYADQHCASIVDDGGRKLAEALAKISTYTSRMGRAKTLGLGSFKTLFIADPDRAAADVRELRYGGRDEELVRSLLERRLTWIDRFLELFSTHPNVVRRIRALMGQ
ncbi:MAG: hypothetical protein AYL28_006750 [Candidatus Bathyarchaeota archaeon B23]|nr:MAG: hypothetical protein AYL28_006750 [Candidatus Bathyarchaeota archaeon B23]